jgi:hypothetical protein
MYLEQAFTLEIIKRLSEQKEDLKDKYGQEIGNILQNILFSVDLLKYDDVSDSKKEKNIDFMLNQTKIASELIKKIKES